jgi:hypothetical protein
MKFSKNYFTTFTVSVADPAVFTSASHELYAGDTVVLETTGALNTPLEVDTTYFVILDGLTADTFQLSSYRDGTALATTADDDSGTHTFCKTNKANLRPVVEDNR